MTPVRIGNCDLFLADCKTVLAGLPFGGVLVTDPPYGIGYKVNSRPPRDTGLLPHPTLPQEPIHGDSEAFDPSHLMGRFSRMAIFGGNHMDGLPAGGRTIIWDKRRDSKPDSHSDCEICWTNVPGADRIHRQKWRGMIREGEENLSRSRKLHRNQKPVALLDFVFDQIGVQRGQIVVDPYMGSGSTGVVAIRRGNPFVGIEIDPHHFEVAVDRLRAEFGRWQEASQAGEEPAGRTARARAAAPQVLAGSQK